MPRGSGLKQILICIQRLINDFDRLVKCTRHLTTSCIEMTSAVEEIGSHLIGREVVNTAQRAQYAWFFSIFT